MIRTKIYQEIDYLGINTNIQGERKLKVYQVSENAQLDFMTKYFQNFRSDLFSYVCTVTDHYCRDFNRYEAKIHLYENSDLRSLLVRLSALSPVVANNMEEILTLSNMDVLGSNCEFAALYYLGLIEAINNQIGAVKLHFMTRHIDHSRETYDNTYFLGYLSHLPSRQLKKILPVVQKIVDIKKGNLHIVGVDYFSNNTKKYKVYLHISEKDISQVCDVIAEEHFGNVYALHYDVQCIKELLAAFHNIITLDLIAVCEDQNDTPSVNFYFRYCTEEKLENDI